LSPETFAAAFTPEVLERHDLGKRLLKLPPRLLRAMLPAVANHARSARHPISDVAPAVNALGREDLDLLVEFVADKYNVGVIAAGRVWTLDSDRAFHEARGALRKNADNEAYAWFHSAPRERYAGLLDVLSGVSITAVSWAPRWLAGVLPVAGSEAPRVFTMIGQTTASS
jgi:hypothetical protein